MNGRELYSAIYSGERVDRLPVRGIGAWSEAVERWRTEGLKANEDLNVALSLMADETIMNAPSSGLPLNLNMCPLFPIQILEENSEYVTLIDEYGVTKKMLRSDYDRSKGYMASAGATSSMSHWINVDLRESERCGILLRFDQDKANGLAVTLDKTNQEVSLGQAGTNWFGSLYFRVCHIYDSVYWKLSVKRPILLRIIARAEFVEVYIDDRLALCVSISNEFQSGAIGYFVEGGKSSFENIRLAELEPLPSL
jgi:hypothetical protein